MKKFTRIAVDYDKGRSSENVEYWAEETRKLANLDERALVLDLGCGTGLYTMGIMSHTSATVCGFDPSTGMIEQAKVKGSSAHWFNATGESIPVRSGIFDCVFSSQVWHHIEDRQGTADECGRVLNGEGTVVIRTISHEQLRSKVVFEFFPEIMANQLRVYPSEDDFDTYFRNAGFTGTDYHAYELERDQLASELIEIAEKKLWSMFRPISQEGLRKGVQKLREFETEHLGQMVRNNETITLVVSRKSTIPEK